MAADQFDLELVDDEKVVFGGAIEVDETRGCGRPLSHSGSPRARPASPGRSDRAVGAGLTRTSPKDGFDPTFAKRDDVRRLQRRLADKK